MKHSLHVLLILLFSSSVIAQDFSRIYEPEISGDYTIMRDVFPTRDDHLLVGYDWMKLDTFFGSYTPYAGIMKTDLDGNVMWAKTLEITESTASCSYEVAENTEGDYYLWGLNRGGGTFEFRSILSKISTDGEMLWTKEYLFEASSSYGVNDFQVLPSGDLQMMISIFDKVIVMRTNADGELIWSKVSSVGPPDETGKNPGFEWLSIPDDGGVCANKAENDLSLIRYSDDGEIEWSKRYNMGAYTHGKTIVKAPNGNILVAGFIGYKAHIMEVNMEDGVINWVKTFPDFTLGFSGKAHLTVIEDDIILDLNPSGGNFYMLKMSETGEVLEARQSKEVAFDYNRIEMVGQNESYYYGAIEREGMISYTQNMWDESCVLGPSEFNFVPVDYTAYYEVDFTPTEWEFTNEESIDVALLDHGIKLKYACDAYVSDDMDMAPAMPTVFPNPSNGQFTTTVPEELIGADFSVNDLSGKRVASGTITKNYYTIDLSNVPNGQYILNIIHANEVITEKIIVLK